MIGYILLFTKPQICDVYSLTVIEALLVYHAQTRQILNSISFLKIDTYHPIGDDIAVIEKWKYYCAKLKPHWHCLQQMAN